MILASAFVSLVLAAEAPLSLPQAVETAVSRNPELKKAELAADSAGWGKLEALSAHLPHIGVRGQHLLDAKYSRLGVVFGGVAVQFPTAFPQTEFDFEAQLLLFDGLGSINRYRAALLESDAAALELSHSRFKLERLVGLRFYQALAAQELEHVADQNIETLENHLKLAQASQRAGMSTRVDVLRIESQLEEARAEKILAADNVTVARNALADAMGVDDKDPVRPLAGALPAPEGARPSVEKLDFDVSRREDVQAQQDREQARDRLGTAAAGAWFPRVSLFGVETIYKFGAFDPQILANSSFQNAYSYGLRFSWNIFDGGASIASQRRAALAARSASEDSRRLLISSPRELELWKRKYVYNSALYQARKRAVEKSEESVRLATLAVKAGTKTHSEALDAELELFRARAGVIRAQVDAAEALGNLELALGRAL